MSELITTANHKDLRWHLLTTVSMASLLVAASAIGNPASAEDADRPTVWIELGGQLEAIGGKEDAYAPPFTLANLNRPLNAASPLSAQKPPAYSFGGEGKISFEPKGTDWVFSAALRYGRSNGKGALHQQTSFQSVQKTLKYSNPQFGHHAFVTKTRTRFNDTRVEYNESHAVVDFMAGKDVGLGMLGRGGSSVIALGVRFAQFHSKSNINFKSLPDPHFPTQAATVANPGYHHFSYFATGSFSRTFRGVGPAISWDGSVAVVGSSDTGKVTLDWGANAAALFGRQTVRGSHQTTDWYLRGARGTITARTIQTAPANRSRSVFVPNVGGFAGLSVRYSSAKLSLGYRADFFFGAMDGGVDAANRTTMGFFGPFATIGIGLGG